jgi:hypothetical protein
MEDRLHSLGVAVKIKTKFNRQKKKMYRGASALLM